MVVYALLNYTPAKLAKEWAKKGFLKGLEYGIDKFLENKPDDAKKDCDTQFPISGAKK